MRIIYTKYIYIYISRVINIILNEDGGMCCQPDHNFLTNKLKRIEYKELFTWRNERVDSASHAGAQAVQFLIYCTTTERVAPSVSE
jgi:hypothetical protein